MDDSTGQLDASPDASVLFVGDTSFGENYQVARAASGHTDVLAVHGYDRMLRRVAPLLTGHDLVIANLETPLCRALGDDECGDAPRDKRYIHWSDPERTAAVLRRHGVTAVSLANNHAYDQGEAGLRRTLESLARHGIAAFGAGMHEGAARRPFVAEVPCGEASFRLAVVGGHQARRRTRPGLARGVTAGVNAWTTSAAARQVAMLRRSDPRLFIVAFPHWGVNYAWRNERQQKLGRMLVEAGADLVLGHGAHAIQEIERYRDRWIVYSLGNFVFGSPGRFHRAPDILPYGFGAQLVAHREDAAGTPRVTLGLDLHAVRTDNRTTGFRPDLASAEAVAEIDAALRHRATGPEDAAWTITPTTFPGAVAPALRLDLGVALELAPALRATGVVRPAAAEMR